MGRIVCCVGVSDAIRAGWIGNIPDLKAAIARVRSRVSVFAGDADRLKNIKIGGVVDIPYDSRRCRAVWDIEYSGLPRL